MPTRFDLPYHGSHTIGSSCQCRKSHCGDKTILRPSYLHNGISYTGKTTSLYWIGALMWRGHPQFIQLILKCVGSHTENPMVPRMVAYYLDGSDSLSWSRSAFYGLSHWQRLVSMFSSEQWQSFFTKFMSQNVTARTSSCWPVITATCWSLDTRNISGSWRSSRPDTNLE